MKSFKKIFCFDLDMTLLDHAAYQVSEASLLALCKLRQDGHAVVIATGRDMDSAYSAAFAELIQPSAIVHSNGQKVTAEGNVIREVFMEKELIRRIIDFAKANGLCVGYNIGSDGCYVNKHVMEEHGKRFYGMKDQAFVDESNLLTHPFYALAYFGELEGVRMMEQAFPELKFPLFADRFGADILTRDVSKANGIQALLEYYEKDWQDVIAIGDSMNDYEMIRQAGVGIAMGSAPEALKEAADYVTLPVEQDGVCHALKHFGFL